MKPLYGWLIIFAFVVWFDLYNPRTLSDGFWSALMNPKTRFWVVLFWSVLTLHLFDLYPHPNLDPIRLLGRVIGTVLRRKVGQ